MSRLPAGLMLLCTTLLLAACSTLPPTQLASKTLSGLPRVQNSPKAPCWQQEQIAAQNSYIDTRIKGRQTAYAAPCKAEPIPPAAPPQPKQPAST